MLILFLTIAVQEHDTVVQRKDSLQDRTDEVRRDGHRRQQCVRTHVEQDRQTGGDKDDHGLKPGLRHGEEHQHDHERGENNDRDRRRCTVLTRLYHAVTTETSADLLAECFLIHGLRYIEIKDRVRAVRRIAIRHTAHIVITLEERSDTGHFLRLDAFEHHMHIGSGHLRGRTELSGHYLQTALHLRVIRQVLGHVGIDVRVEHQYTAHYGQTYRNRK